MNKVHVYELQDNDSVSIDCRENGVNLEGPLTVIILKKRIPEKKGPLKVEIN
jgi:hypothetical protein